MEVFVVSITENHTIAFTWCRLHVYMLSSNIPRGSVLSPTSARGLSDIYLTLLVLESMNQTTELCLLMCEQSNLCLNLPEPNHYQEF